MNRLIKTKMQGKNTKQKHLLWMTSLLPSCSVFIRLCGKCHVIGLSWHDNNNSSSRITWTFYCCADKLHANIMQHLVGRNKTFSFTLLLVIKAKMKFLKITFPLLQHHPSWTVWYYYRQNLFQVLQKLPFCEQDTSNYSNCHAAVVPVKFDQLHSSQNNWTAGRNTSLVGWRYAVLNITKVLHDFLHR